jgi:hypothetical protein
MTATLISDDHLWELVESIWGTMLSLGVTRDRGDTMVREPCRLTASVHIRGAFHGTVQFLPTEQFARRAAALMLDVPESSLVTADVDDAVGELCNMLGGGVKNLVPCHSSLSLHRITRDAPSTNLVPGEQVAAELHFTCEGQPLAVRVLEERGDAT